MAAVAVLAAGGCWWDQPGGGPGQTFHNPLEERLTLANVASLAPVWTGRGGMSAVVDGKVVGVSGWPSATVDVVAHDLATGDVAWSRSLSPAGAPGQATVAPVVSAAETPPSRRSGSSPSGTAW